ncbi:MAG: response regulator transcription factor [Sandarakinorhabdus sp.]|nr:response regulator transcription factor [Sandarakinorhabdus sp.]
MRWNGESVSPPRLLVADRAPMVAAALAALLRSHGYDVAAQSHDGAETAALLGNGGIDAAIIDIDLPGPGPQALLDGLRARGNPLPIVITAPSAYHDLLADIIDGGADGVVLKSENPDNLMHCLAAVTAGGQWIDRHAVVCALDRAQTANAAGSLTRRERDVAALVIAGQRNRSIGAALGISEGTVKMHLHNVYAKLGLETRTQLATDERVRVLA